MNEREKLYNKLFEEIEKYRFIGFSDQIVFKESKYDNWRIEVYSYPAYPEEELTEEDCYYGDIYVNKDLTFSWEGETFNNIEDLFNKLGLY